MPNLSQSVLNNAVWMISLILQCALLAAVFARDIPRRLPFFTLLLAFYPLRAALLFGLYAHLAPATYAGLYTNLSLVDLGLQVMVVYELMATLLQELGGLTLSRLAIVLSVIAAVCGATFLVIRTLPPAPLIPVDRIQTALSFLMLAVFLWVILTSRSSLLRPITLGFALQASISLVAQSGRITAAVHRDAAAYARWSYASAAGYLIVVCLWLLTVQVQRPAESATT